MSRLIEELQEALEENARLREQLQERDLQIQKLLVLEAVDLGIYTAYRGEDQTRELLEHISELVDARFGETR